MGIMADLVSRRRPFAAAAAVALMLAAGAWLPARAGVAQSAADVSAQLSGAAIFAGKGNCATCHGPGGTGTRMAPDLTDAQWLHIDGSYESIVELVKKGVDDPKESFTPMPPRGGGGLTDDEVAAVSRYVYGLSHSSAASKAR
jgi:cytochrome c oxidase cbb3-type subunit 3